MEYTLTLRKTMSAAPGKSLHKTEHRLWYEAIGMPLGETARIWKPDHENWHIQRNYGEWYGEYGSAEQARAALEAEVNSTEKGT